MLNVADWLYPVPQVVFLVSFRTGQVENKKSQKLGVMCADVCVCVPHPICQVART